VLSLTVSVILPSELKVVFLVLLSNVCVMLPSLLNTVSESTKPVFALILAISVGFNELLLILINLFTLRSLKYYENPYF